MRKMTYWKLKTLIEKDPVNPFIEIYNKSYMNLGKLFI